MDLDGGSVEDGDSLAVEGGGLGDSTSKLEIAAVLVSTESGSANASTSVFESPNASAGTFVSPNVFSVINFIALRGDGSL